MLEVRALEKATELLRQAQDIRSGAPGAVIVPSMVGQRYRLTQDMKNAASALNLPIAHHAMILRQVYADAPGQGSVVWNMGTRGSDASREVHAAFAELLPEAIRSPRQSRGAA